MIFGRSAELAGVSDLLVDVQSNGGGLVVFEGVFGSGKTELLREAGERARQQGFHVLSASADFPERLFRFGVVQQLFESLGDEFTDTGADSDSFRVLHGLYRKLAELSRDAPVLILVDNLEFIDEPSIRWLDFVVRRSQNIPVAIIATLNPGEQPQDPRLLPGLLLSRLCRERRRLPDLRPKETAELLAEFAGSPVSARVAERYHQVTDGNPVLLRECLRVAQAARLLGSPGEAGCPVVPSTVDLLPGLTLLRDRLLAQLQRASPHALSVACAAALLGSAADDDLTTVVSGLTRSEFADVRVRLEELGILQRNAATVRYPLVGELLVSAIPVAKRPELHSRAARALYQRGAAPEWTSMHVVEAGAFDEPWAEQVLLKGGESLAATCPKEAARIYERVLQEPVTGERRREVLARLGTAQLDADVPASVRHLEAAMELAAAPDERAQIALGLSCGLAVTDRHEEAVARLIDVLAKGGLEKGESAQRIVEQLVLVGTECGSTLDTVFALLGADEGDRGWLGRCPGTLKALVRAWVGSSAAQVQRRARDLLACGHAVQGTNAWYAAAVSLVWSEEHELASRYAEDELRATNAATLLRRVRALLLRTQALHGLDRLEQARQCGGEALDMLDRLGIGDQAMAAGALAHYITVLVELDEWDTAANLIAERGWRDIPLTHWQHVMLAHARAVLRVRAGDHRGGLADATTVGEACRRWRMSNPAVVPWQLTAAECHQGLQAPGEAERFAAQGLAAARRWGSPRLLGRALRTMGMSLNGPRRTELLTESAALLESCGARLELARTFMAIGTTTREKHPVAARRTLRHAYELAVSCGGKGVARRIQEELTQAGGRIAQPAQRGIDLLTVSELRVAEMAVSGMTNQAIARRLKVSLRNIEAHLTHTYRKLGVTGRSELSDLLRRSAVEMRTFGGGPRPMAALPGAGWVM
ncbi:ATP-binding protein [Streptantibioticus ferralitis]|uniref:LuxR C-terminal-related transcriptional regulator n=1 Tax=Streptantibioticus ferralitis TaxID=236510 RepID=A0ABT5Z278_9ACTN|nr:LuxR family transcriptional regulator [Streptantibioticus ferralitis]MDF2257762.1 LuxR C-terminal-related transcriptional regulator [Streptantibioticus ferralitis]